MVLPTVRRNLVFRARGALLKEMLVFGLPTIPAGLAAMVVQVIDRPLMQILAGEAAAGIYGANYRLGIVMMLVGANGRDQRLGLRHIPVGVNVDKIAVSGQPPARRVSSATASASDAGRASTNGAMRSISSHPRAMPCP